jgi:hypothetical protein
VGIESRAATWPRGMHEGEGPRAQKLAMRHILFLDVN